MDNIDKFEAVCNKIASEQKFMPLGFRAKNLGCIRFNAANRWNGQLGQIAGFCRFDSYSNGVRALVLLLCKYVHKYNLRTINQIIERYAPSSDGNDTRNYIRFCIENNTSYLISSKIDVFKIQLVMLVHSIIEIECGFKAAFMDDEFIHSLESLVLHYIDFYRVSMSIYGKDEI